MSSSCLLRLRDKLAVSMSGSPPSAKLVLTRAKTYESLRYLDLAAADAYYALTLAETALDPAFSDLEPQVLKNGEFIAWIEAPENEDGGKAALALKLEAIEILIRTLTGLGCLRVAFDYLVQLNSLIEFDLHPRRLSRGEAESEASFHCRENQNPWYLLRKIIDQYKKLKGVETIRLEKLEDVERAAYADLPTVGFARREVYPWNSHEPDRTSPEALGKLSEKLAKAAPKLEAKGTFLPVLGNQSNANSSDIANDGESENNGMPGDPKLSFQLGLFAKEDLPLNEEILLERSIITAIRPIDASLCDACASPLPELSSENPPVACSDCNTAVFCSVECLNLAKDSYHNNDVLAEDEEEDMELPSSRPLRPPSSQYKFCDNEDGLEEIGRDSNSSSPAEDLYFLLITRTIAMAETQNVHPLDLFETKYLCGEFNASPNLLEDRDDMTRSSSSPMTLPFTFMHNILLPFRYFTTLLLSHPKCTPYSAHWLDRYDHWIIQTLYAKFRGVASARQSTWDAKPEVAAVHPLWCLANHSCDPNVTWQWGGKTQEREIAFKVRAERAWHGGIRNGQGLKMRMEELNLSDTTDGKGWRGIKGGEEILNHYCDITLPVQERRAYARGPLGGDCRCERCLWESGEGVTEDLNVGGKETANGNDTNEGTKA